MGNASSLPLRVRRRRPEDQTVRELLCTKPSGLYPTCAWDPKLVRRLILRGELAPRYPGRDDPTLDAREECPICMLVYPVLNETRCCSARLCTECYLQIRPPRHNKEPCPFCKYKRVEASYKGPRDQKDIEREQMDEKRALDAMKRANLAACTSPTPTSNNNTTTNSPNHTPPSAPSTPSTHVNHASAQQSLHTHPEPAIAPISFCPSCGAGAQTIATDPLPPCACPHIDGAACPGDHRARYFHRDSAPVIDPLVLEAMASEVTYSNSALERGSASSSGVLDSHAKELRVAPSLSAHDGDPVATIASPPRVVQLPWYGIEMTRESAGPSMPSSYRQADELFHEDEVSLNEAIRRSLIDM